MANPTPWHQTLRVYLQPKVLVLFFLGFSAGLPLLLVFGTLSAWLARLGVSKTEIGYFSWVGITYSLKFMWAPVVDRLRVPLLTRWLGKRRSWMLLAQVGVAAGLLGIAYSDPATDLRTVALLALLVAFSSATQDIVIDAFRIESAPDELQGAMAANYQLGYRLGMIVAGAGALYLAGTISWSMAYQVMALCMAVGFVTTLLVSEPPHEPLAALDNNLGLRERRQVAFNIAGIAALFGVVAVVVLTQAGDAFTRMVFSGVLVFAAGLGMLALAARGNRARPVVGWFYPSVILPFADFFQRMGWLSLAILAFIT
ncbi:MAG: MFS transporter, partial [Bacteroidales bacterium]|nr:MFS transporter [Bacteroidales bacterium]